MKYFIYLYHLWLFRGLFCYCYIFFLNWISLTEVHLFIQQTVSNYWPHCEWVRVARSCLTLCDPMDCSLPGSSVHGNLQARILEWVVVPSSRGSSHARDWTQVSHTAGGWFTVWAPREALLTTLGHENKEIISFTSWCCSLRWKEGRKRGRKEKERKKSTFREFMTEIYTV